MDKERKSTINKYLIGVKSRDKQSLDLLYDEISPTVRYIALKYLRNSFDVDDLVQDFWKDIYKIADGFIFFQNAFSYLCKVMTRRAINRYKSIYRQSVQQISLVDYEISRDYSVSVENLEINYIVESAMQKLTKMEKIIVQLTFFEEKTVREIAKEVNLSKSQVGKLKLQALEKLKSEISQNFVDKKEG